MCNKYWRSTTCSGCPIAENEKAYEACSGYDIDVGKMEELVMSWAAENPEHVYPSWGEWLLEQGVVCAGTETRNEFTYQVVNEKFFTQIDADTAKKLGIEPKEI